MILYGCTLQNPNALDSKVLVEFDHVKNGLKIDDEGELEAFFLFFLSSCVSCTLLFLPILVACYLFTFLFFRVGSNDFRSNL